MRSGAWRQRHIFLQHFRLKSVQTGLETMSSSFFPAYFRDGETPHFHRALVKAWKRRHDSTKALGCIHVVNHNPRRWQHGQVMHYLATESSTLSKELLAQIWTPESRQSLTISELLKVHISGLILFAFGCNNISIFKLFSAIRKTFSSNSLLFF